MLKVYGDYVTCRKAERLEALSLLLTQAAGTLDKLREQTPDATIYAFDVIIANESVGWNALIQEMNLVPDADEGGYVASFPDLHGCLSCGNTIEDTVENAKDAIREWLEAVKEGEQNG